MAYDHHIAQRIRAVAKGEPGIDEKRVCGPPTFQARERRAGIESVGGEIAEDEDLKHWISVGADLAISPP